MPLSPFSLTPDDTPAIICQVSASLALYVFPALFVLVAVSMRLAHIPRSPYFAYLCAFGALGSMSLCLAVGNNPLSALAFYNAFLICPLLMARNLFVLRLRPEGSIFHTGARWASLLSLSVVGFMLLWTLYDMLRPAA